MTFEEQYESVLQNIEFAIVTTYRRHPELVDFDVESTLDALIRGYQHERQGKQSAESSLRAPHQELYDFVKAMCEWRLGRATLSKANSNAPMPQIEPITLDELIACLKRIRKSVRTWNQRNGRRGYLDFVSQYIV
jgi:hypothetical protein